MSKRKKGRETGDSEATPPRFRKDMIVWDALEAHPGVEGVPLGLVVDEVVERLNGLS